MKKLWMFVFIILISTIVFAGGGNQKAGTAPSTAPSTQAPAGKPSTWISDKLTVKYLFFEDPRIPYSANWPYASYAKERTGVTLNIINVIAADYYDKLQVLLASGDPPDFVSNTGNLFRTYFNDNMWVPISDYWDYMPNFKKAADLNKAWDAINAWKENDGKFYNMPELRAFTVNNAQLFMREDLMAASGIKKEQIKTSDDLLNAFRKLVKDNPKLKGVGVTEGGIFPHVARMFNDTKLQTFLGADYGLEWTNGKWVFGPATDKSRAALSWIRTLVAEKLLDVESLGLPREQVRTNMSSGQYVANYVPYSDTAVAETAAKPVLGPAFSYTVIVPPATPWGRAYSTGADGKWQYEYQFTQNALKRAGKADFINMVKFVDWLRYSDEMWYRYRFGVEGVTFDMVKGEAVLRPTVKTSQNPSGTIDLEKDFGCGVLAFRGYNVLAQELTGYKQEYVDYQLLTQKEGYIRPPVKPFSLKMSDQDIVNQYMPGLRQYLSESTMKFIMGDVAINDANWAAFTKQCENYGSTKLIELFTKVAPQGRPNK
ncbi:MAG: extracellular solute-binding protein [Treponema sp.]|nr:extracellular solute-binding protein [Treponema sp.]